jgi:toxin ParE1/3/4
MRIVLDDEALEDLRGIHAWITKDSPRAADELVARIFDKIENLLVPELTFMGRPGLDRRTETQVQRKVDRDAQLETH